MYFMKCIILMCWIFLTPCSDTIMEERANDVASVIRKFRVYYF